ncbi:MULTISPECIES: DUF6282 family protein [Photorhabdus]|uniref:DUF6282 family protein n=1 Tax=Photorhabdus TaxID=29487 RepID=UPI000DCE3469|nr:MULTISPECIES: DUF6282 family protein [Photorhabdus]MCT8342702.1 DUF6282 family protein [Photorhabdus kleinii]RAW97121.1 hypothetical protein CKY05_13965 [Photorhabdus sp. S10-54]RAW97176.1 hypothetical protein CKY03_13645 [Photorhabdus sp. S9-53]RAX01683.1 hypothetical protein CKY04_13615 [Photorhabdus sp. S8-52]
MSQLFIEYWERKLRFLDVHYHARPDSYIRRYNVLEAGREYVRHGGGVVLKNHLGSVTALSSLAQEAGLPVFGSIVLNATAGGLAINSVIQSLSQYQFCKAPRLLVHLPTIVPTSHKSIMKRAWANAFAQTLAQQPLSVVDSNGRLHNEIHELISFAQQHNVVLSSGHASRYEVMQLIDAITAAGGCKFMLNQPASPMTGLKAKDLKALGEHDWLYVEQTALTVYLGYQTTEDFFEVLSEVNNVVYSSDLGQPVQPDVEQWLSDSERWFKTAGLSEEHIRDISLLNPLRMLAPD